MKNFKVIENINQFTHWNVLLDLALEISDYFCIIYPDGEYDEENPLLTGKVDFDRQLHLESKPWEGMENSSVYSGELTEKAKGIIKKYMYFTSTNDNYLLWNFSLFKKDIELLNVQDFDVCLVQDNTELTYNLNKINISII